MTASLPVPVPLTEPSVVTVAPDRSILADGTPIFPIGIYGLDDDVLEEAAAAGFNLTHTYSRCCGEGELEFQLEFLDRVAQAGLRALVYPIRSWTCHPSHSSTPIGICATSR